ncbi:MAG: nitroreductase family protein [Defluviitaleaceae bacterium]|nr:nitroreductase family protein [Defluviitaleaceae bacterium]
MNEVLKAIAERNSCRDFTGQPLTKDQVDVLVKAALAAPSAVNRQPWHVIMCTNKALLDEMDINSMEILAAEEDKSGYNRMMERGGKIFYNAPAMMVVASDGSDWAAMDAGILVENVALAAHALGLGNVICGMARIPLNGPKGKSYIEQLKFPEGYTFGIAILVGEAKSGKEPHELDMNKVTYIE